MYSIHEFEIMSPAERTYRLCVYCRGLEFADEPCRTINGTSQITPDNILDLETPASGLSPRDASLIRKLQGKPSTLCDRCSRQNILKILTELKPLDPDQRRQNLAPGLEAFLQARISLGRPSSLLLSPSCQFCRLLYCVVPRRYEPKHYDGGGMKSGRIMRTGEPDIYLEPCRSYLRASGWSSLSESAKIQHAVMFGLFTSTATTTFETVINEIASPPLVLGPVIALESRFAAPDRTLSNLQPIENILHLSVVKRALDDCLSNHGGHCHMEPPAELCTIRVIDVIDRVVVPFPRHCDYIALSYVWGGVQPLAGALENRCLPRTIEDAITVTKALGRRYLWVDALCIDQSPNPSPAQIAAKIKQLDMMSLIYSCATVTIVALTGKHANAGLPGISTPRLSQVKESIDGCVLFTSPQHFSCEIEAATYSSRAWTLQEYILSRRTLVFTQSMVVFSCLRGGLDEGTDIKTLPSNPLWTHPLQGANDLLHSSHSAKQPIDDAVLERRMDIFSGTLASYTSRQLTNESDSLNAFRGLLSALGRQMFPGGFVHGLPLRSHTFSLGWMHSRKAKPRRRPQFPSWSWSGWEGTVIYPEKLINTADKKGPTTDRDLDIRYLSSDDNWVEVEGWCVDIDIRTDPYSELFIPGKDQSVGTVREGDCPHNNTLKTGRYRCLVIQRFFEKIRGRDLRRETAFLLALEQVNDETWRKALLSVALFFGQSFDQVKRVKQIVRLI